MGQVRQILRPDVAYPNKAISPQSPAVGLSLLKTPKHLVRPISSTSLDEITREPPRFEREGGAAVSFHSTLSDVLTPHHGIRWRLVGVGSLKGLDDLSDDTVLTNHLDFHFINKFKFVILANKGMTPR